MKVLRKSIYLWLVMLLPLSTYAELTGTVVFVKNRNEIWFSDIRHTSKARQLYKHDAIIRKLSVQKDSRHIAIVSSIGEHLHIDEIYLVDTSRGHAVKIQTKIDDIENIDISHNGDLVFSTRSNKIPQRGIYLIKRDELRKQDPRHILLKATNLNQNFEWSPDGKQIVHGSPNGSFVIDIETKKETRISKRGRTVAFSPDGTKFACSYFNVAPPNIQIDIISLETLQPLRTIDDFVWHGYPSTFIRWSLDGEYLIYNVPVGGGFVQTGGYMAAPVSGGPAERISVPTFDWFNPAYPVEPVNRLTTLWGKIKQ